MFRGGLLGIKYSRSLISVSAQRNTLSIILLLEHLILLLALNILLLNDFAAGEELSTAKWITIERFCC